MPKNLERLCLTGSIIGYCALDDLAHPGTLPALRELNLDYVHNLSSNSRSFRYILQRKDLTKLEVRHCNGISNVDLMGISDFLVNLRILNLSEIKFLNDAVIKSIAYLKRWLKFLFTSSITQNFLIKKMQLAHFSLVELLIAFTSVSDEGISCLVENNSKLVLLDIRGCPRVTGQSLLKLSEMKSLREVWILQFMTGCAGARISLKEAGSQLLVLDEIDRQKMAVPQRLDFYSIYFANMFGNAASGEIVEDA
ncbi:hypothetical protein ANCCAN_22692 [Ancylostoma caninum]|uniref:Leucine Rich repeat-containing domain protein n=1 Tax=Ancylostoma caninum TaxID=29170 RepID=A0A368FHA6_ANCCA|nr:hypothetical protein ANCCAN_22692 [Ancylostoma caninum]